MEPIAFVGIPSEICFHAGLGCERVLAPPEPAAGRADVKRALLRLALRVDRERRHAAGPLRRLDERLRAEPVDVERVGSERVPLRAQLRAAALDSVVGRDRALDLVDRDLTCRVRAVRVCLGLGTGAVAFAPLPFAKRRVSRYRLRTSRFFGDPVSEPRASRTARTALIAATNKAVMSLRRCFLIDFPFLPWRCSEASYISRPGESRGSLRGDITGPHGHLVAGEVRRRREHDAKSPAASCVSRYGAGVYVKRRTPPPRPVRCS